MSHRRANATRSTQAKRYANIEDVVAVKSAENAQRRSQKNVEDRKVVCGETASAAENVSAVPISTEKIGSGRIDIIWPKDRCPKLR